MEWHSHDDGRQQGGPRYCADIRCLRKLGLWCILWREVVHAAVVHQVPELPHHGERLALIVVAAIIWREEFRGKLARSDNSAVVAIIRGGMSRNPQAAYLMRYLTFMSAVYQFKLLATHVRGIHNILEDALSRNNLHLFHFLNPQADERATPIPETVLDLVLLQESDWKTRNWTSRWNSF